VDLCSCALLLRPPCQLLSSIHCAPPCIGCRLHRGGPVRLTLVNLLPVVRFPLSVGSVPVFACEVRLQSFQLYPGCSRSACPSFASSRSKVGVSRLLCRRRPSITACSFLRFTTIARLTGSSRPVDRSAAEFISFTIQFARCGVGFGFCSCGSGLCADSNFFVSFVRVADCKSKMTRSRFRQPDAKGELQVFAQAVLGGRRRRIGGADARSGGEHVAAHRPRPTLARSQSATGGHQWAVVRPWQHQPTTPHRWQRRHPCTT
jgi:hypothetical protein